MRSAIRNRKAAFLLLFVASAALVGVAFFATEDAATALARRADLVVSKISAVQNPQSPGAVGSLSVTFTVKNQGKKVAPKSKTKVEVYPSGPEASVYYSLLASDYLTTPRLKRGKSYTATVPFGGLGALPPGASHWVVRACADWTNVVNESKEGNNCKWVNLNP